MFGRRFYDPDEDGDTSDGLLALDAGVEDHLAILRDVRPLLGNADITVVNLESALSDAPERYATGNRPLNAHPDKDYVIVSDGSAAGALREAGVDVVGIGINHFGDLLDGGVKRTLDYLVEAGFPKGRGFFGGGLSEDDAWEPAVVTVKDQSVAFIACTTVTGKGLYAISHVASDEMNKGGAAECSEIGIRAAVSQAVANHEVVVMMIHGGGNYSKTPSPTLATMTRVARENGATLVINHHPHVVGGFDWDGTSLAAWSLGNFVFDQSLWPTFESYLLSVHLRRGEVVRAYAEPLMVEGYRPKGLTGSSAAYVARGAAVLGDAPFIVEAGAAESDLTGIAWRADSITEIVDVPVAGMIIPVPQEHWVSGFSGSGDITLGRDLLWVGSFEDEDVDSDYLESSLWDLSGLDKNVRPGSGYQGSAGLRLKRSASNLDDAVSGPRHRIPVNPGTNLSAIGMVRVEEPDNPVMNSNNAEVILQLSWYVEMEGSSYEQTLESFNIPAGADWQSLRLDATVPPEAVAVGLFLRLVPPGLLQNVEADFDNIKLIAWSEEEGQFGRRYDHVMVHGDGKITLSREFLPGTLATTVTNSGPLAPIQPD